MTVQELKNLINSIPDRQNNKNVMFEYSMFCSKSVDRIYNTKKEIKEAYSKEFDCLEEFKDALGNASVLISFGN